MLLSLPPAGIAWYIPPYLSSTANDVKEKLIFEESARLKTHAFS
jgi:hypothetical protein